ncbi:hypothetical protein [Halorubrum salinum]|uniref:hypothetical protein n=1 Tax=Halorubrum salinum TaxID=767517 RepID=UPI0021114FCE|nr:hypothetical protein [Halorubrum salinum]
MVRRWVLAVVVALAVVASAGVAVTAQQSSGEQSADYTLSELRQDGTSYSNSPDSVRLSGSEMYWMVHWPAGLSGNPGDPSDQYWEYLSPDTVVDRNSVYIRSINTESAKELTVTVATYDVATREVTNRRTNTTTIEQYATNVTTQQREVAISRGWAIAEIPLGQSDGREHVTVWVNENGQPSDELRWTFEHESVATTQELPFRSWGGALQWLMLIFVVPTGVGGVISLAGSKKLINKAGKGIGWGYGVWTAIFGLIGTMLVVMFWGNITGLLVQYPWVMVLYVIAFLFVLMIETFEQHTKTVRFEQDELATSTTPADDVGVDVLGSREKTLTVIDRPDEPMMVASDGLMAFLSRLATGSAAKLRTVDPGHDDADMHGETDTWKDPLRCQAEVKEGDVDMRAYVHPLSSNIVDYQPEGWKFSLPALTDRDDYTNLVIRIGVTLVGAFLAHQILPAVGAAVVFALGVGWIGLRPKEAYARVWPAPAHYRSARATALHLAEETDNAETIEQEREKRILSEVSTEQEIMDAVDNRDRTLIDGMFGIGEDEDDLDGTGSDTGGVASGDD